jgi:glycine betaine/choline ABC-type transport system substrate-binding protein
MSTMKKALLILTTILLIALLSCGGEKTDHPIVIGSKHFTEQRILGEMIAALIEYNTPYETTTMLGLQGTKVCFGALRDGQIDLYPEYTGTGLVNILEETYDAGTSREEILQRVRNEFKDRWNIVWLDPLGFANTYVYAMRSDHAEELGVEKISDLENYKGKLIPGFDHEYTQRPEYKRFKDVYGFALENDVRLLAPDITYRSLQEKEVDIIDAFSTDGRIQAYKLRVLEDDKNLFPPYDACIVTREDALQNYPGLEETLHMLTGKIQMEEMQEMNYQVTNENKSPSKVARDFLVQEGLIE